MRAGADPACTAITLSAGVYRQIEEEALAFETTPAEWIAAQLHETEAVHQSSDEERIAFRKLTREGALAGAGPAIDSDESKWSQLG
jgi:hypothetical protein